MEGKGTGGWGYTWPEVHLIISQAQARFDTSLGIDLNPFDMSIPVIQRTSAGNRIAFHHAAQSILTRIIHNDYSILMKSRSASAIAKSLSLLLLVATAGCTLVPSKDPKRRFDVEWHPVDWVFDSLFANSEQDRLRSEGYGYNNPEAERIRKELQR